MKLIQLFPVLGLLLLFSCAEHKPPHDEEPQEPITAPSNIIPVQEADNWYKNYGEDQAGYIETGVNEAFPDLNEPYTATRFVTADFETLFTYMQFIQQESEAAGVSPKGLRVYFGATPPNAGQPGRETVFFNPVTSFEGIKGDISYAIATDATGKKTAVTVGSVIDGKTPQGKGNLILQGGSIQSLAGDDVTWPPPPFPNDPNDYH